MLWALPACSVMTSLTCSGFMFRSPTTKPGVEALAAARSSEARKTFFFNVVPFCPDGTLDSGALPTRVWLTQSFHCTASGAVPGALILAWGPSLSLLTQHTSNFSMVRRSPRLDTQRRWQWQNKLAWQEA